MPYDQRSETAVLPRPLGAIEKLFWLADQNRPLHFAIAAEVGGFTRIGHWHEALNRVCRQSALIWSRIVADERGAPVFLPAARGSIPLQVVEDDPAAWAAHVAAQLAQPFDAARAPLLRAVLLHDAERSALILCAHHSIADGLALSFLMRDVLRALAGETVQLGAETAAVEQLVAARHARPAPPAPAAPAARAPLPYRPLDGAIPRVEALRLARETTQALRERARAERATLQGALCAALTTAAATAAPGRTEAPPRVLSPIDLRTRLLGGSEHVGVCVNGIVLAEDGGAPDFWSRARSFSERLAAAKSAESLAGLVGLVQELMAPVSTVQQAQELMANGFGAEIVLSNLGAAPLRTSYATLALQALWGPAVHNGFAGAHTVGAVTVGNRLHLLHTRYEADSDLLGEAAALLTAALRDGPGCAGGTGQPRGRTTTTDSSPSPSRSWSPS